MSLSAGVLGGPAREGPGERVPGQEHQHAALSSTDRNSQVEMNSLSTNIPVCI